MRILIIGGTGFLGYHITKHLLDEGQEITLFNRGKTPDDFGTKVERISGDRYDGASFHNQLSGKSFDAVVDMISYQAADSQLAVRTFSGKIGHYIHISTAAVYIITKDYPCPLREEDFDRELYPKSRRKSGLWTYGYNKRKCEEVLFRAFKEHGFPVTIFRLPIVMGERDHTLRPYSYFIRILDGKPLIVPDGGLNVFTPVYQEDVVRAVSSSLKNTSSLGEVYNLAQKEILTLRGFILKASKILGRKVELVDIPSRILKKTPVGLSSSPLFSRRPFVLDTKKAERDLQFSSTPFEIWLEKTIRWYVEGYKGYPPENYMCRDREVELIQKYQRAISSLIR